MYSGPVQSRPVRAMKCGMVLSVKCCVFFVMVWVLDVICLCISMYELIIVTSDAFCSLFNVFWRFWIKDLVT